MCALFPKTIHQLFQLLQYNSLHIYYIYNIYIYVCKDIYTHRHLLGKTLFNCLVTQIASPATQCIRHLDVVKTTC